MNTYSDYGRLALDQSRNGGVVQVPYPERPEGLSHVIDLHCEPIPEVRIGVIGLGLRGPKAVERLARLQGTRIVALGDLKEERVIEASKVLTDMGHACPKGYYGDEDSWRQLCQRQDIDLIYITTNWGNHCEMGVYAMECGHHVAIEVPAAIDLDEIWRLITTAERTQKHCMQLENCIYDYFELDILHMVRHGILGDIVQVDGGYIHYLNHVFAEEEGHWRLKYNRDMRGDLYATHGMGPACQILDIHRSDQLESLIAMDTAAITGPRIYQSIVGEEYKGFANADQTDTLIRTSRGRMIHLRHNVMTPSPYSRRYNVTGTQGYATKYPTEHLCLLQTQKDPSKIEYLNPEQVQELRQQWRHPMLKEVERLYPQYDEWGGKNFIMDYRLITALQGGRALDMDVYDLAEWCAIGELSRLSLDLGGRAVSVPDFTRGSANLKP